MGQHRVEMFVRRGHAHEPVTFRLGVGSHANPKKQQKYRGPVRHDFRERPICGLEGRDEWWDFQRSVDKPTESFVVCLEVFPSSPA